MNQTRNISYAIFILLLIISSIFINSTLNTVNSTVVVVMEDSTGQWYKGSGFFVQSDVVCTNYHVIKDRKNGFIRFVNKETKYDITEIIAINEKQDLAILKVECDLNPHIFSISDNNTKKCDCITVFGNSSEAEGITSCGVINKIIDNVCVSDIRELPFNRIIETTAKTSGGGSGGPVLNSRNEVVGITFANNKNFHYAISSVHLKTLLVIEK